MQKRLFLGVLGIRMTRTLLRSKRERAVHGLPVFRADSRTAFFVLLTVQIGAYVCFVCGSLVVLVIAFAMPFGYTCFTIRRREIATMAAKKNLCAQIDIDLHRKITEAKEQAGLTTAEYITNLLLEYYEMKENGGNKVMANNTRTLAFQIPEKLFNRIKAHLERETARTSRKLTQRDFVLGLIEEALEAAERQAGEKGENAPCEDGAPQDGPQPQEEDGTATDGEEQAV